MTKVTKEKAKLIEARTREQAASPTWVEERKWRLTSSSFGEIINASAKKDMHLLCKRLFDPPPLNHPAIIHGRTYESKAIQTLEEQLDIRVRKCGFFIDPEFSFMGATPDGLVEEEGLVEVKCPYSGKNQIVQANSHFPYLMSDDGVLHLKKNHKYYYQIMGQLGITRRQYCYFVVFTFKGIFYEKIHFRSDIFHSMEKKLKEFYDKNYLPFVASKL